MINRRFMIVPPALPSWKGSLPIMKVFNQFQATKRSSVSTLRPISSAGFVGYPLISDIQDEPICKELEQHGLQRRDAQHITQAVCNECDIFLTRDAKTIIRPYRDWLEGRFLTSKSGDRPSLLQTAPKRRRS